MNVELLISGKEIESSSVFGEITICDFIAGMKNQKAQNHAVMRLGQNLNHDDSMHKLNNGLRVTATEFVIGKNQEVKDKIKAQVKDLEESGFINDLTETNKYGDFGILHAMFYCYVEPVNKLTNNKVKAALKKIADKAGLQSFDSFVKNGGKAGEKKAGKEGLNKQETVMVSDSFDGESDLMRHANQGSIAFGPDDEPLGDIR